MTITWKASDLIAGLERAADLFDDIQDRKKEIGVD